MDLALSLPAAAACAPDAKYDITGLETIMLSELVYQTDVQVNRAQNGFKPEASKCVVTTIATAGIQRDVKSLKE